jgi:hypothetical protein
MGIPSRCTRCGNAVDSEDVTACDHCGMPLTPVQDGPPDAAPPPDPVPAAQVMGPALTTPSPVPAGPAWHGQDQPPATAAHAGRKRAALVGVIIVAAAAMGAVALKVLTGVLVAGIAAQALTGLFGGPYARLPSDVRNGFEHRVDAAVGDRIEGLSAPQTEARIEALLVDGLPRLDDETLVARLRLQVQALDAADTATCAAFTLSDLGVARPTDEVSMAFIEGLDDASLTRWVEIQVAALEAAGRASPAARTVTTEADELIAAVTEMVPAADLDSIVALTSGASVSDAAACSAGRAIYHGVLALEPDDLAVVARFQVSP